MMSISKLLGRPQPPDSYESWHEAVIPEFIYLQQGKPVPTDVDKLKKWLKSFARWKSGYEGFLEIERALERRGRPIEARDRRSYEYFAALLWQSGQWHATLLLPMNDVSEPERAQLLDEIDRALAELRKRLTNPSL
jgi:hypothetical protein